jgi:hypothetical protein
VGCRVLVFPQLVLEQSVTIRDRHAVTVAVTRRILSAPLPGSDLYFGKTKASTDVVDAVVKKQGGVATLFVKSGDQCVRDDGTSAVGTGLDANSPAIAKLNNGEACCGGATIFGKTYAAGYEPIKDASGTVIGAYFVGYPK